MHQKLLITGSCGFIANNLVRKIIYDNRGNNRHELISIDRVSNSSLLNEIYAHKSHRFYLADITDEHIVQKVFEYEKPDIVIHAAALTHVDESLKNPNAFITNNVLGTQILVNAAVKYGIKKFVMVSTDEIYGSLQSENDPPWTEESSTNPRNPYSASKLSGELVVKAAANSFGLHYNITRSSNNYGRRQTPDKFIPKVIKCILQGQKIPVYGQGLQMRDWLHVEDNCSAIMKIVEKGSDNSTYNISANQEFTNIEVVQLICNAMGKGWDLVEFVKDREGHDFRYSIDASKLKALDWTPKYKFKDGIVECINWYVVNQHWLR